MGFDRGMSSGLGPRSVGISLAPWMFGDRTVFDPEVLLYKFIGTGSEPMVGSRLGSTVRSFSAVSAALSAPIGHFLL